MPILQTSALGVDRAKTPVTDSNGGSASTRTSGPTGDFFDTLQGECTLKRSAAVKKKGSDVPKFSALAEEIACKGIVYRKCAQAVAISAPPRLSSLGKSASRIAIECDGEDPVSLHEATSCALPSLQKAKMVDIRPQRSAVAKAAAPIRQR